MAIHLIRHGETDWNAQRRIQGRTDIPLNEQGLRQAEALAGSLMRLQGPFAAVYTSGLARASQTGKIVADALELPLTVVPGLTELSFGSWEGRTWAEIQRSDGAALSDFEAGGMDVRAPGGESYREMLRRVLDALLALPESDCIAVTHGGVIRALKKLLSGESFAYHAADAVGNASVTVVERAQLSEARERI